MEQKVISKKLKSTKNFLVNNRDIFFTYSDRGNVTVCLNKNYYLEKKGNFLSDKGTYQLIKRNSFTKFQFNTQKILKTQQ